MLFTSQESFIGLPKKRGFKRRRKHNPKYSPSDNTTKRPRTTRNHTSNSKPVSWIRTEENHTLEANAMAALDKIRNQSEQDSGISDSHHLRTFVNTTNSYNDNNVNRSSQITEQKEMELPPQFQDFLLLMNLFKDESMNEQ
eukprot:TRINITY_DN4039_c0_g1_i4.p1 TRINITY_DN4039_c0_g1~~TRINITY_DN4039_c0_g1_i4.p1  ORF type:complete len:141 (+),score=21.36 TRINITY_DN4039_c0_g1_i4:167-589(+)